MIALGSLEKRGSIYGISSASPCRRRPRGNYMTKCSNSILIGSIEVRSGARRAQPNRNLRSDPEDLPRHGPRPERCKPSRSRCNGLSQTSAKGSFRCSLPWGSRGSRDVQLLPSSYLLRFGFVRPNCARKQNSRPATDQVLDVGPGEFPDLSRRETPTLSDDYFARHSA